MLYLVLKNFHPEVDDLRGAILKDTTAVIDALSPQGSWNEDFMESSVRPADSRSTRRLTHLPDDDLDQQTANVIASTST